VRRVVPLGMANEKKKGGSFFIDFFFFFTGRGEKGGVSPSAKRQGKGELSA